MCDVTCEDLNKELIYEDTHGIPSFLREVIGTVLKKDKNLSKLNASTKVEGATFLVVNGFNLGRAISNPPNRLSNIDESIKWTCDLNNKEYCLNKEYGHTGLLSFIPAFNDAYRGMFEIASVDSLNEKNVIVHRYLFYEYTQQGVGVVNITNHPLSAPLRTKPFMLLAGISGTGKSRIVKEMAFQTCPNRGGLRNDAVTPGNYCLVEVKPNWHDSTELLGYKSVLSGRFVTTKFVRFLVKAMCHPGVPFFLCLDEMNLAPVEQYFAEFLSVLESRKKGENGKITSEPLIDAAIFNDANDVDLYANLFEKTLPVGDDVSVLQYGKEAEVFDVLKREGLRIPSNLIVVGTVNMDETTHQFSRKVIDRAMTIEMNIEDGATPFERFFESDGALTYLDSPIDASVFLSKNVTANQALSELSGEEQAVLHDKVPTMLASINKALDGTPFKIAYRVQNELIIYFAELRRLDRTSSAEELLKAAVDAVLMMKVLPRVEGDKDLLGEPLTKMLNLAEGNYEKAAQKLTEMKDRLDKSPFTSFWP